MTQDEIIRNPIGREQLVALAREASNTPIDHHATPDLFGVSQIERFAALVAAHEREACAKVCDEEAEEWSGRTEPHEAVVRCAAAIRNRSNK